MRVTWSQLTNHISNLERASAAAAGFNQQVERYSRYSPSPLSVQQFLDFGRSKNNEVKSLTYLRYELPTRLANMLKEMHRLPSQLLETQSFQHIKEMYEETLSDVLAYEKANAKDLAIRSDFCDDLERITNKHRHVVEIMAHGVMEYKDDVREHGVKSINEDKIQYFLDRFYISRISFRVLANQHLVMFSKKFKNQVREPGRIGAFHPQCNIRNVIEEAVESATSLCDKYYLGSPDVKIDVKNVFEGSRYIEMGYVPSHLHHICCELLKNSMRATVERHGSVGPPPINILVTKGKGICIRISDRGGGAPLEECRRWMDYTYSTAPPPTKSDATHIAPLAGYGYGIPLSRLYARYLGGDLMIQSIEGWGTDCYIYLKSDSHDAVEVLPTFTTQLGEHYKSKKDMKDWVSKAGLVSTKQLEN